MPENSQPLQSSTSDSSQFLVSDRTFREPAATADASYFLEAPGIQARSESGAIRFSGWVFGQTKPHRVNVKHGSRVLRSIPVGFPRPDVSEAFKNAPNSVHSGFSGLVFVDELPSEVELEVEVEFEDQRQCPLGRVNLIRVEGTEPRHETSSSDTSQHGEIEHLFRLIAPNDPPFLVDVGAHDGFHLSNSFPFLKKGWTGILVEPLPSVFQQLQETHFNNPKAICVNKACSEKAGREKFFLGEDGELGMNSTLCNESNEWFDQTRSSKFIEVEVTTLTDLLIENNYPADFSLLLVDAEGMDYEVLLGLDFERFQPRVILTEEYPHNPEKHESKYELLRNKGYVFQELVGCNSLWLRSDLA